MSRVTGQQRHTAAERREAILEAAISEFAIGGLQGASTDEIARRAGISQAYLFRLYGTKMDLFLAVVERVFRRTLEVFQLAAGRAATGEAELVSVQIDGVQIHLEPGQSVVPHGPDRDLTVEEALPRA